MDRFLQHSTYRLRRRRLGSSVDHLIDITFEAGVGCEARSGWTRLCEMIGVEGFGRLE